MPTDTETQQTAIRIQLGHMNGLYGPTNTITESNRSRHNMSIDISGLSKPLDTSQIEFRIQSISKNGWATILAYKNARVDMERLDDVCGPENWQRKHEGINGHLQCAVGIYFEDKGWVFKQDVGAPSNQDATKGEASDSFKRACFNWGIGRELYEFPRVMVQLKPTEFTVDGNKGRQTYDLRLYSWRWYMERDESAITFLEAVEGTEHRFKYGTKGVGQPPQYGVKLIEHNLAVQDNLEAVYQVKSALAGDDYVQAAGYWAEIDQEAKRKLWVAPTKGGIFTTKEIAQLKSDEMGQAVRNIINGEK